MLECQLKKLFTEANLQKTTKESSYYSPVTEHWAELSLLYIFCNCRYYHCCTLNSTEKILRSSKNILCIKHCQIQPYLYERIHVFQRTKIASLHYQNIQWYCFVFSVNTLTCTVWIFPCILFFLYCEVPLRRHLWLCCNISNVISLHVSHDYVLRITWQFKSLSCTGSVSIQSKRRQDSYHSSSNFFFISSLTVKISNNFMSYLTLRLPWENISLKYQYNIKQISEENHKKIFFQDYWVKTKFSKLTS